jgi:hypothetical protein
MTESSILSPTRFDLVIKLQDDGFLDISYENTVMWDSKAKKWTKLSGFAVFNWKKFSSDLATGIIEIANNPEKYEKNKKDAMADIHYVYAILKNFTELAFNDFIENYAKESVFVLDGLVSDVKAANIEKNGTEYKYLVTMTQKLEDDDTTFITDNIYCRFYTNRADVIRLSKTRPYKFSAQLIGGSQSASGKSVTLEFVVDN